MSILRTAECVSPKHPDKLCDQISDAILDSLLATDPNTRAAIETVGGHGQVLVIGEITSEANAEIKPIVKRIAGDGLNVNVKLVKQSSYISEGVDSGGAGDQGIMVGYATSETEENMPLEYELCRNLNKYLYEIWPYDGKTQITLKNDCIATIVASFQNSKRTDLTDAITDWLWRNSNVKPKKNFTIHANPAGDWSVGGFDADTGLTGRKLAVDNYGPRIPLGGGCFSGKDATKVDRSAAYMARKIAKDSLYKFKAREVFCYLAYAIGVTEPVETTLIIDGKRRNIRGYDLTPRGIIEQLNLTDPQFEATARYGHFGNDFTWG